MKVIDATIKDALDWAASFLDRRGIENSRFESEILLAHALGVEKERVLVHPESPMEANDWRAFQKLVRKRGEHFPAQYILKKQEFMSLPFEVEEGVLIPRQDTEVLVETVLKLAPERARILDVGTGSGAVALALAYYLPGAEIVGIDVSRRAVELAGRNSVNLGLADRVDILEADVFNWNPGRLYDVVVSNPPYIRTCELDLLQEEVRCEPRAALDGGADGLKYLRRLVDLAGEALQQDGILAVEIGWDQGQAAAGIAEACSHLGGVRIVQDYAGRDRVVVARRV